MPTSLDWITDTVKELPALSTANEAARVLRMSPRNLRRLYSEGRLSVVRTTESGSSRVLIPRREIERFLRACAGAT